MTESKKNKIAIIDVSNQKFEGNIKKSEEALGLIEKELQKIDKIINKLPPNCRFFVCDAIIGFVLNSARLPSYILNSIASKYHLLSQLPHIIKGSGQRTTKIQKTPSYLG